MTITKPLNSALHLALITLLFLPLVSIHAQSLDYGTLNELTSNLPIIIIDTDGQEIPDEPKITAQMGIIDNGPGELNHHNDPYNDYDGFVGIEMRGQSSQYFYPKKSYSFETRDASGENLNVSILGMPEENDWILYAPYGDKSMLRNVVTFAMASSMDSYCTRTRYCEVMLNGEYQGVYVMMEKIKKDENRVKIAKLKPEDIEGDELTGGYIVRVDKMDGLQVGQDAWVSEPSPAYPNAKINIFQYFYPDADDIVSQQKSYIQDYILETGNSLTKSTFTDPEVGYNGFINTGSFVDQMLLNEISKEVDKYRYSTYFFKEKDSDGGKLFAGPAWDFNLGYSNVDYWPPGNEYQGWLYPDVQPYEWSIMFWWKRLNEDSYFRSLAKLRWNKLREYELSDERMEFVIDSITALIDDAQERNYERWPILGTYVWPNYNWANNTYPDEVEFFEDWFINRLNWIDYNLPGIPLNPSAELYPEGNGSILEVKLFNNYFSRTILKEKYFNINNAPPGLEIDTVIYQDASTAKVYLNNSPKAEAEISLTLDAKIINTWEDLCTNTTTIDISSFEGITDDIKIFSSMNTLYLECSRPDLLGGEMTIYNISGQKIKTAKIDQSISNTINVNAPSGIYLCTFEYAKKIHSRRVLLSN